MQRAITTRFHGPTNTRQSRIKAIGVARSTGRENALYEAYSHPHGKDWNHCRAAALFAAFADWPGLYVAGGLPDESGNCYVNLGLDRIGSIRIVLTSEGLVQGEDWFYIPVRSK